MFKLVNLTLLEKEEKNNSLDAGKLDYSPSKRPFFPKFLQAECNENFQV
jgi:hypothetical protein